MFAERETWNPERVDQLKHFFQAGLSSSQIARELGLTRNAVIGKLHRLGLSRPRDLVVKHIEQKRAGKLVNPRRRRLSVVTSNQMQTTPCSASSSRAETIPILDGRGCTLLELGQGRCRWPIESENSEGVFFCGNEPAAGLPYCAGHARLAYRPTARPRRSTSASCPEA